MTKTTPTKTASKPLPERLKTRQNFSMLFVMAVIPTKFQWFLHAKRRFCHASVCRHGFLGEGDFGAGLCLLRLCASDLVGTGGLRTFFYPGKKPLFVLGYNYVLTFFTDKSLGMFPQIG